MRPIPTFILALLYFILVLQIAPAPVYAQDHTYLIQLKNGGEIICHKMAIEGDTLFYLFSSFGRKRMGINKSAVKAIFLQEPGPKGEPPGWGDKNILPEVMDPSHGPWE